MNSNLAIKAGIAAIAVMVTAGCTGNLQKEQEALSARVDQLAKDVASARSTADAANAAATNAGKTASAAQSTANQALNAANQSQACCDATNEKIDRMFKRGQMK
ncbi:MAG: alanine-zipper protein [Gammaproteobacteria bacterium]|nr:alanine-zipper protein [Gammaproteobacteria bacterium]